MKFRIIKDKIGFSSQYFLPRQGWNSIWSLEKIEECIKSHDV